MKRDIDLYLTEWKNRKSHKPLIIRGARQVGKTWSINNFSRSFSHYVRIDFEEDRDAFSIFRDNNIERILGEITLATGIPLIDGETLLFLDECQLCPDALKSLRYFYEKRPGLHLITAGSLMEFALNELHYPMPVGRVEFMYMYPMSFSEFLSAADKDNLRQYLEHYELGTEIPPVIHALFLNELRNYYFIGGMPEVVHEYIETNDLLSVQRVQNSLVTSMQNDFSKYTSKNDLHLVSEVFLYLARNTGTKIKFSNINKQVRSLMIKRNIDNLFLSRIVHKIVHSDGNGVPLGGNIKTEHFKTAFIDIGLSNRLCGLDMTDPGEILTVREGLLAEQFIAQELVTGIYPFEDRELYYWIRQSKNSNSEVDYLIQVKNRVIPLEIKAGTTGSLKSLHVFMASRKNADIAVRFNLNSPSLVETENEIMIAREKKTAHFRLLNLPLYMISQVHRLVSAL